MKFCLIIFIGCLAAFSVAKSNSIDDNSADAKIIERAFVVGALTGFEGERTFDSSVNFVNQNYSFCIPKNSDSRSKKALKNARKFAKDFNRIFISGIKIKTKCNKNSPNIFRFLNHEYATNGGDAYWNCEKGKAIFSQCHVEFSTRANFVRYVPHEMINLLGFNDSENQMFRECLVYDNWELKNINLTSGKLCDIEKRLIVFKFKRVLGGWDSKKIINSFNDYWKTSAETKKLAEEIGRFRQGVNQLAPDKQLEGFCSLMFGDNLCGDVLKTDNWFCNSSLYGDTTFCRQYG